MISIHDACDYIIESMVEAGETLVLLKLQKLLYYVQAWNLAFTEEPLFEGKFQAWVHGPVNREIYDRFSFNKILYSSVGSEDLRSGWETMELPKDAKIHIENVLEVYGGLAASQLEEMTHGEEPWINARHGYKPNERCEVEIEEEEMRTYYAARLED